MIDRIARDKVISAFEAYLDDQITAFEFDERLFKIQSDDQTVHEAIRAVWCYYDDCTDHRVHLSKPEWDYFQRLLLVLGSDAELSRRRLKRWSKDHGLAWLAVVAFAGIVCAVGWGWHLLIWALPFGLLSMGISLYRHRQEPRLDRVEAACTPFRSFPEIRRWRRNAVGFRKRPYRAEIGNRRVRSKAEEAINRAISYGCWFAFAPLVLLYQGFPTDIHQFNGLADS